MLQPSRTKFKKQQKGRNRRRVATKGNSLCFGEFGIKTLNHARITARQIEASRIVISKYLKRGGRVWIRIFPDKPITKKPIEVRQGKGKGNVEFWVAVVEPGKVLFEVTGVSREIAIEALNFASYKLPVKTVFVSKLMII